MRVGALLCSCLAALAAAAPARAVTPAGTLPDGDRLLAGPVVAGEGAFVLSRHGGRYRALVLLPGAAPRVVGGGRIVGPAPDDSDVSGEFAAQTLRADASPTRVAWLDVVSVGNARYQQGETRLDLFAGARAGPAERLAGCASDYADPTARVLGGALDGDALALVAENCPQAGASLTVRDLATGATRAVPLTGAPTGAVDASAGLVAVGLRDRPVVAVHSARTGDLAFEAPAGAAFALDGAGRLFTLEGAGCDARLAYASATDAPTAVLGAVCAGGRVTATGGRALVVARGEGRERELRSVTPAGATATIATSDASGTGLLGAGADGGRVVFAVAGCAAAEVLVSDVATPGTSGPATRCPASVRRRPVVLDGRRAQVRLRCSSGCLADVLVRSPKGRRLGRARVAARGLRDAVAVRLGRRARVGRRVRVDVRFRPRSDLPFGPVQSRQLRVRRNRQAGT